SVAIDIIAAPRNVARRPALWLPVVWIAEIATERASENIIHHRRLLACRSGIDFAATNERRNLYTRLSTEGRLLPSSLVFMSFRLSGMTNVYFCETKMAVSNEFMGRI